MPHSQSIPPQAESQTVETIDDAIREIAREGARSLLQHALETEIANHLDQYAELLTEDERKTVVRNGYAPERTIFTGIGPVAIQRPRVDEREAVKRNPEHKRFSSGVLPRFLRRTPTIEGVVATLYLKGISTNDFDAAIQAIYGDDAGSLSASTVSRLKDAWHEEYEQWRTTRLSSNQYAYIWADGVYFSTPVLRATAAVFW